MPDDVTFQSATPATPPAGTVAAADDVGGKLHQRIKRSVGPDGSATDFLDKASRSDTFTGAANGVTVDVSAQGMSKFGIQVKGTGAAPTAWVVVLEVSLDGTNFQTLITHQNTEDADGGVKWGPSGGFPALYFRSRCVSITLGGATNAVATIVGKP